VIASKVQLANIREQNAVASRNSGHTVRVAWELIRVKNRVKNLAPPLPRELSPGQVKPISLRLGYPVFSNNTRSRVFILSLVVGSMRRWQCA
jgi:hypothetical protein